MATIRNIVIRIGVTSRSVDRGIGKTQRQLKGLQRQINGLDKDSGKLGQTFTKLGNSIGSGLGSALSGLARGAKLATLAIGGVAVAAAGLHTAVQVVGGLGQSLAPLAGLLAALPGAAAGAVAAFGTLKLATAGMGKAFSAVAEGNQEKLDKALEKLGPTARSVVKEFQRMFPTLRGIQLLAQEKMFTPLRGELTKIVQTLKGPLADGVGTVAHEFGMAALEVAHFARSATAVGTVKTVLGSVAGGLREIRPAIQPLLSGFAQLASVGAIFLVSLTPAIKDAAIAFGQFMSSAASSGRAMAWMQNGLLVLKQLGSLLANVGGIIMSVFRAAGTAGGDFLGTLGALAQQLNVFLKSAAGQQALTSFFQAIAGIGASLGPVLAALITQIGALAPAVGRLAMMIGPILTAAINAIGPALAALEPGLAAMFTALGQAVTALAPALVPLARAISAIAIAAAPVIVILGQMIGQLVTGLAPVIQALAPVLGQVFVALLTALQPLIPVIIQLAGTLGQQLAQVLIALTPQLVILAGVLVQILPALTPLIVLVGQLLVFLAPLLPVIVAVAVAVKVLGVVTRLWAVAQVILNSALLANPIVLIAAAIIGLAAALFLAWQHSETFRNIVTGAFGAVADAVSAVAGFFAAAFSAVVGVLAQALPAIGKVMLDILNVITYPARVIIALLVTPFYYAFIGLRNIVTAFWSWAGPYVARGIGVVVNAVLGPLRGLLAGWRAIWGAIGPAVTGALNAVLRVAGQAGGWLVRNFVNVARSIINVFRGAGSWLYNVGRNLIIGLWNGIVSLAGWIARSIGNLIRNIIPGPIRRVLGIGSPSKVAAQIGRFVGQGLAVGMLATQRTVANAAMTLANAAVPSAAVPAMAGMPVGAAPAGTSTLSGAATSAAPDHAGLVRALVTAMEQRGVGAAYLDGQLVSDGVSRHTGRRTQQQRRAG